MPHPEQEKRKTESSEIKKLIKGHEKELKENIKKIKNQEIKIKELNFEKDKSLKEQHKLSKEKESKVKKKEQYEQRIEKIKAEILDIKESKIKEKDTTKLDIKKQAIENKMQQLTLAINEINKQIAKLRTNNQPLREQLTDIEKDRNKIKVEIERIEETIPIKDNKCELLINQKKLALAKITLVSINLFINLQEEKEKIIQLEIKRAVIAQNIATNQKQLAEEFNQTYGNKKTKKELEIADLDIKLKLKISELYKLAFDLNKLDIKITQLEQEILKLNVIIFELEKVNLELTAKKDMLRDKKLAITNSTTSIAESISESTSSHNSFTQESTSTWTWFKEFFKPVTRLVRDSKQRITLNQYQKQAIKLETEIKQLEAEKLKDFWNKFWLIISCGCYNNHGKKNSKIEKKRRKLLKIREEIEKISKKMIVNNQLQPSTSAILPNQDEKWNAEMLNSTKVEVENMPVKCKASANNGNFVSN